MNTPLITIIIPTLNSAKFLPDCLKSINEQRYKNYEIIMVDGGSTDDTIIIGNKFQKVIGAVQTGKGLTCAWNDGILKAKGELIAFLDSDDIWDCNCLQKHVESLEASPHLIGSLGHLKFFLNGDDSPPPGFKISLLNKTYLGYMPGCFVGRREVFDRIGLFEPKWNIASDLVWFAKLKKIKEELGTLNDVVLYKRIHQNNLSYSTAQTPVYKKVLMQFLHDSIKNKIRN